MDLELPTEILVYIIKKTNSPLLQAKIWRPPIILENVILATWTPTHPQNFTKKSSIFQKIISEKFSKIPLLWSYRNFPLAEKPQSTRLSVSYMCFKFQWNILIPGFYWGLEFLIPLTIHKQDGVALMGEGFQGGLGPSSCSIYSSVALVDFGRYPRSSVARAGEPGEILFFLSGK